MTRGTTMDETTKQASPGGCHGSVSGTRSPNQQQRQEETRWSSHSDSHHSRRLFRVPWWAKSKTNITTDNAFIEARIHSVSPKVGGTVTRVLVKDNQPVKKGDLLVELDPRDYQVQVQNAQAELDMARNQTSGDYAQVGAAKASAELAKARLDQAELDLHRGKALFAKEVIPTGATRPARNPAQDCGITTQGNQGKCAQRAGQPGSLRTRRKRGTGRAEAGEA